MRLPNSAHEARPWRIHEVVPDFTVEDVWAFPVHGGAEDFETLLEQVTSSDPANAVALGQSICPMLSEPSQTAASVASAVADSAGLSLGAANLFTGIAVTFFCPAMVSSIGNGTSPIPLSILGL